MKDLVYDNIKSMIFNGEIKPGDKIYEDEIAKKLNASRTPVREAVNRLTAEKILVAIPQRGSHLRKLSKKEIIDIIHVRKSLEALAVTQFIENAQESDIKSLKEININLKKALENKQYNECNFYDLQFHKKIAEISNNAFLIQLLERVEEYTQMIRMVEMQLAPEVKNINAVNDHDEIIEKLELRNIYEAVKCMNKNIDNMMKNIDMDKSSDNL